MRNMREQQRNGLRPLGRHLNRKRLRIELLKRGRAVRPRQLLDDEARLRLAKAETSTLLMNCIPSSLMSVRPKSLAKELMTSSRMP